MSRSRSLCLISAALLAACGDDGDDGDTCGPGSASPTDLVATGGALTLTYGNLTSLLGNDCPAPDAPAGVVSVSIEGMQVGGSGLITLCIPRPDLLTSAGRSLGASQSDADVRIFDLSGAADGCTYTFNAAVPPTGTVTGIGVCEAGDSAAGFALEVDGMVSLKRTCGATMDTVDVALVGTVAVARRN